MNANINKKAILKRIGWVLATPFIIAAIGLYFVVGFAEAILIDPFIWLITGKTLFMAFMDDKICDRGQLFGEKTDYEV